MSWKTRITSTVLPSCLTAKPWVRTWMLRPLAVTADSSRSKGAPVSMQAWTALRMTGRASAV